MLWPYQKMVFFKLGVKKALKHCYMVKLVCGIIMVFMILIFLCFVKIRL